MPEHINNKGTGSNYPSAPFRLIPLSARAERLIGQGHKINIWPAKNALGEVLKNKEIEVRLEKRKQSSKKKKKLERERRLMKQEEIGGGVEQNRYFTRSKAMTQNGTKSSGSNAVTAPAGDAGICVTRMMTRSQRRRELGIKEEPTVLAEGIVADHAPATNEGKYQLMDQYQHNNDTGMIPIIQGTGTMVVQAPITEGREQSGNQHQRNYDDGIVPVIKREREDGYLTTSLLSHVPVAPFAESSTNYAQIPTQPHDSAPIPANPICSYFFGPQAAPLFDRPNMPAQYGPVMRAVETESLRKQNRELMREVQELTTKNTNLAEENVDLKMKLVRYEELLVKSASIISKS